MDIGNILNTKGNAAAQAAAAAANGNAEHQLQQQLAQVRGQSPSDAGSDRDDRRSASRYSSRGAPPLHMTFHNGMRYASPTAMQNPMAMLQNGFMPSTGYENPTMHHTTDRQRSSSGDQAQKAFPCSSCGKGFARRSDLARHGMSIPLGPSTRTDLTYRKDPQWRTTSRL
jgi:hypothetical protein